jgi:site-specific recombinase XerC
MGAKEVEQFLTYLAVERQVSAKTQKQALCALVFLYQTVLGLKLGRVMSVRGRAGDGLRTTMVYLHVMEGGTTGVRSPLDTLEW